MFIHITMSEYGLLCALEILSAGINDFGRLCTCFSSRNSLPSCSIIFFICSLFKSSSHNGHAFLFSLFDRFVFSLYAIAGCLFTAGSLSDVFAWLYSSQTFLCLHRGRKHHIYKDQHAHLILQHPPSSVSLSSSSTRVLLQMKY